MSSFFHRLWWFLAPRESRKERPTRARLGLEELEPRELPSAAPPLPLPFNPWTNTRSVAHGFTQVPLSASTPGVRFGRETLVAGHSAGSGVSPGRSSRFLPPIGVEARLVTPPGPVVNIDTDWLRRRGPGPYVLNQADTTYVLQTDVRAEGTAFVVAAANVVLDLNEHTVTYGDGAPPAVFNGGFERGDGRSVPGWDLTGAPAAFVTANTNHLYGDRVLRLGPFRTLQRIFSEPIPVVRPGHTHTATVTPANPNSHSTVTLSVIDTVTGRVLGSGKSASTSRGYSAVAHFTPTTANPVRLRIDVTPRGHIRDTLDIDQATVTTSGDYGILASDAYSGDIPGHSNLPDAVKTAYNKAANFTVKNGQVRQGRSDGYASSPLFFRGLDGFTVQNVETFANGTDTLTLEATYASARAVVRDSTFREDIDTVSNRQRNFATLKLNNISGPIVVAGNRLIGSPQAGIMLAGNDPRYPVSIRDNEFRQRGVVANAYAIALSAAQNFTITGNTVRTTSGRGFLLDGYSSELLGHGEITGNTVDVRERPNREYPNGLEATALRLRNTVGSHGRHADLSIRHNTFIARSGPGQVRHAYAARLSYANRAGTMNDAGITLEGNTFKAVATTADPAYQAKALVLDRIDAGIGLRITGNVLESNDAALALADSSGGVRDVKLTSNTIRRSADGANRPFTAVLAGHSDREVHDVRVIDTRLEGGAMLNVIRAGTGVKGVRVS